MLALAWRWASHVEGRCEPISVRLAASLCAGIGGHAGAVELDGLSLAYRALHSTAAKARAWRPAVLPSGKIAVFHGYFDNSEEVAALLGTAEREPSRLYGLAVEHWQDDADRHIIGDYCAVIADPGSLRLRLSRSPLRAPPLHYSHGEGVTAAASVPRAIFAAGIDQRLNEARMADAASRNLSDDEATFFEGVAQVPTGCIVELEPNKERRLVRWYSIVDLPFVAVGSDAEVVARAGELLDEGVRACLRSFKRPGSTLSGGLDSTQVTARASAALPQGQKLPTFTFHPEAEFDGRAPKGMIGDERPLVEDFAAMHPGIEPHFTANEGYGNDYRCRDLFHLIGAPTGLSTMYVFHGLLSEAAKAGCDVLLVAEWGDLTFSDRGDSGYVEYFLKGRWRQLWLALTRPKIHEGSVARRFLSRTLSAFLPYRLWRSLRRLLLPRNQLLHEVVQPLSAEYRRRSGADARLEQSRLSPGRYQPLSRRHSRKLLFGNGDLADVYQGFEQMYEVAIRDPTAYRPFVEFCLGLPTKMFMRDGQLRWLAREMAKGIMPEGQRRNEQYGWWDADWHLRIGRRRHEMLAELDRIEQDARLGHMFDIPRLRSSLEDWPETTETDPRKCFGAQLGVPWTLIAARFVNYVEGRNATGGGTSVLTHHFP